MAARGDREHRAALGDREGGAAVRLGRGRIGRLTVDGDAGAHHERQRLVATLLPLPCEVEPARGERLGFIETPGPAVPVTEPDETVRVRRDDPKGFRQPR